MATGESEYCGIARSLTADGISSLADPALVLEAAEVGDEEDGGAFAVG